MDKKKFELLIFCLFFISLLYVPTKICVSEYYCIADEWLFIWEFEGGGYRVDMIRLIIQTFVVAGILFAVWRFKFKV
jgi:hypothetical protein